MKIPMPNVKESLDKLYTKLRKERRAEVKRRIHMLVLIKEGKRSTRKAVAKYLAVHRNTIRDWLNIYEIRIFGSDRPIFHSGKPLHFLLEM